MTRRSQKARDLHEIWCRLAPTVAFAVLLLSGCSSTMQTVHPSLSSSAETGTIVISLTDPMRVTVMVDDQLIVEHKNKRKIVINEVPAGMRHIRVMGSGGNMRDNIDENIDVELENGEEKVIAITTPSTSKEWRMASGIGLALLILMII